MEIEICKENLYLGKDNSPRESYDLLVKGDNPDEVAKTYLELRKKLNKMLKEES